MVNSVSTFARSRIETITGRIFSLATLATSIETVLNATSENVYTNKVIVYGSIGLILVAQLCAVLTFWVGRSWKYVYLLHGLAYLIAFAAYPFSVGPVEPGFRPWLWWATGTATMAVGMYLPKWWAFIYVAFMPTSWFLLRIQPIGGSGDIGSATLDSIYIVLFAVVILTLIGMMRLAAMQVDKASDETMALARQRAAVEASEAERQKLDDLVHDQVLTTLLLAAKAETPIEQQMAADSAENAMVRLDAVANDELQEMQDISVGVYLDSLSNTITRGFPGTEINLNKYNDFQVPIKVCIAFSDATIQALHNSVQHAGRKAVREVRMKSDRHGLKVVVKDNGKGFRVSAIPKNRMGVRNSIRRRVTAVGGEVNIQTAPRKGATIVLTWSADV